MVFVRVLPPSGLPAISPSRGEIGRTDIACRIVANRPVPLFGPLFFGKSARRELISPLVGEMPSKAEGGIGPMAARRLA
ncbi:hypothetical protein RHI9324_02705 [Rhizobium sp. CECT 9324]|jgi:hypothetical protein|nr:hypothetical protein RHI9324_02705 [Rhizobium sp. CECT 9324]